MGILLLAAAFVMSHGYTGIRHDGILYLGEALLQVEPERMSHDLFFVFGSQASFSVVPHIYGYAIDWLGVGDGTRLLLACSFSAYFLVACWLVGKLSRGSIRFWSLVALFCATSIYGGHRVFAYAEPFFTARSFAEPVILLGIGLLIGGRTVVALAVLVVALLLHPLMGIPAFLFAGVWLTARDRRWLWASVPASMAPLLLALAGVRPFDGLFASYDPAWMEVVQTANPFVFVTNWKVADWGTVVFDVGVLAWASRSVDLSATMRAFARTAVVAGLIGIVASTVGADLFSNVLITGLQLWRAHWLMHWAAVALFVPLFVLQWRQGTVPRRASALLLLAAIQSITTFAPIVFIFSALLVVRFERRLVLSRATLVALVLLNVALVAILLVRQVAALHAFADLLGGTELVRIGRWLSITWIGLAIVALGMRFLPQRGLTGAGLASVFAALVLLGWDQREPWTVYQENYTKQHPLLWEKIVAPSERLYWFREIRTPWLLMHHANYYSPNQASGVLFNRKTALELDARSKLTGLLEFQETICRTMNALNRKATSCEPDLAVVKDICTQADHLSYVVMQSVLSVAPAGELRTGFIEDNYEKTFYLYRCSTVLGA